MSDIDALDDELNKSAASPVQMLLMVVILGGIVGLGVIFGISSLACKVFKMRCKHSHPTLVPVPTCAMCDVSGLTQAQNKTRLQYGVGKNVKCDDGGCQNQNACFMPPQCDACGRYVTLMNTDDPSSSYVRQAGCLNPTIFTKTCSPSPYPIYCKETEVCIPTENTVTPPPQSGLNDVSEITHVCMPTQCPHPIACTAGSNDCDSQYPNESDGNCIFTNSSTNSTINDAIDGLTKKLDISRNGKSPVGFCDNLNLKKHTNSKCVPPYQIGIASEAGVENVAQCLANVTGVDYKVNSCTVTTNGCCDDTLCKDQLGRCSTVLQKTSGTSFQPNVGYVSPKTCSPTPAAGDELNCCESQIFVPNSNFCCAGTPYETQDGIYKSCLNTSTYKVDPTFLGTNAQVKLQTNGENHECLVSESSSASFAPLMSNTQMQAKLQKQLCTDVTVKEMNEYYTLNTMSPISETNCLAFSVPPGSDVPLGYMDLIPDTENKNCLLRVGVRGFDYHDQSFSAPFQIQNYKNEYSENVSRAVGISTPAAECSFNLNSNVSYYPYQAQSLKAKDNHPQMKLTVCANPPGDNGLITTGLLEDAKAKDLKELESLRAFSKTATGVERDGYAYDVTWDIPNHCNCSDYDTTAVDVGPYMTTQTTQTTQTTHSKTLPPVFYGIDCPTKGARCNSVSLGGMTPSPYALQPATYTGTSSEPNDSRKTCRARFDCVSMKQSICGTPAPTGSFTCDSVPFMIDSGKTLVQHWNAYVTDIHNEWKAADMSVIGIQTNAPPALILNSVVDTYTPYCNTTTPCEEPLQSAPGSTYEYTNVSGYTSPWPTVLAMGETAGRVCPQYSGSATSVCNRDFAADMHYMKPSYDQTDNNRCCGPGGQDSSSWDQDCCY